MSKKTITVEGLPVAIEQVHGGDYVNITDIARRRNENKPADSIATWLRSPQTLLYLEAWEELHNPGFKLAQMSEFRLLTQHNRFAITPKRYIEATGAIGIVSKQGRTGGGTWAHSDIALEFCTWVEPRFKVYFFREFQRLKRDEYDRRSLEWHVERVTDLLDEARNWMDTIPGQRPARNRLAGKGGGGEAPIDQP